MEVGKEGQKETPNSMHQCSPLFSGMTVSGQEHSETTFLLVSTHELDFILLYNS